MAAIGQTLREARMRARIDMTEVEARTKIRARYLRAIENEEWDLLPGPVYIRSFLRTYADYLGLDSRLLVDEFKRQYERPSDNELHAAPTIRRDRDRDRDRPPRHARGPVIPPWLVILVVLIGVVAALYLIGSGSGNGGRPSPTSSHTGTHRSRPKTTKPVHHAHHRPKLARVKLVVTGPVYICVENRAGHVMLPAATYNPGQTIPLLKARQLFLTLGNNGVSMTANGKHYPVAASPAAIGLKVTAKGVSPLPAGRSPTCAAG